MIVYSRNPAHDPPRRDGAVVTTSHEEFFFELEPADPGAPRDLREGLLLELQPGDATRYLFSLVRDGDEVVMACVTGTSWAANLTAAGPLFPHDLAACAHVRSINPYTAAIACDVFNAVFGHPVERCYDWDEARPREL